MLQTTDPTLPMGELEKHRGWSIKKTSDGIICLDPEGRHCLPGNAFHTTVESARKSINYWILAKGNAFTWQLLHGHAGTEDLADIHTVDSPSEGQYRLIVSKRDNPKHEPTYEYSHQVQATGKPGTEAMIHITSYGHTGAMTPDSALALALALRKAAVKALSLRKGDSYCAD